MWEERWRGCSDCFYNSRRAGEPRLEDPLQWEKQVSKGTLTMARPSLSPGPAVAHGQQRIGRGGKEGRAQCPARQTATRPIHSPAQPAKGLDIGAETGHSLTYATVIGRAEE